MPNLLKSIRRAQGLSQEALGSKAGLSGVYISALERGARIGPVHVWDKLEAILGVDQKLLRAPDNQRGEPSSNPNPERPKAANKGKSNE